MRRLLLVTTSYPGGVEGSEAAGAFVADFAVELAKHVDVAVVAPGIAEGKEKSGVVSVTRFPAPVLPLSQLQAGRLRDWPAIFRTLVLGERAVRQSSAGADHILALWALPSGYWAWRAAAKAGIGFSTWALGSDIWTLRKVPIVSSVLRWVLRGSRMRFADGYALAEDVKGISGLSCEFLASTRHLPIVQGREPARGPPYRLAFLGRWHPHKGVDLLLDALESLDGADWARIAAVRIAGGGPMAEGVAHGVQRLQAAGRPITLEGYLDRRDAAGLLQWADYVLIPSRIESIPVIFSDALQAGRPVVASPVGDLPRLLAAGSGVLAAGVGAGAFRDALREALTREPRAFAGAVTRLRAEFMLSHVAERMLRLVEEADRGWRSDHPRGRSGSALAGKCSP